MLDTSGGYLTCFSFLVDGTIISFTYHNQGRQYDMIRLIFSKKRTVRLDGAHFLFKYTCGTLVQSLEFTHERSATF